MRTHVECGHSACSQHYIDTGRSVCVKQRASYTRAELRAATLAICEANGYRFVGLDVLNSTNNPRGAKFIATARAVLRAASRARIEAAIEGRRA